MEDEVPKQARECVQAFADGNYRRCLELTAIMRDQSVPNSVRLVCVIAAARLDGGGDMLAGIRDQIRPLITADALFDVWLMGMLLGLSGSDEVLRRAADNEDRCRFHYYTGALAETGGDLEAAGREYQQCISFNLDLTEVNLAKAHVRREEAAQAKAKTSELAGTFTRRDYQGCIDLLTSGGKFHGVALPLLYLCMHRTGGSPAPIPWNEQSEERFVVALVNLACGAMQFDEVIKFATGSEEQAQAQFVLGARMRTLGKQQQARKALQDCLENTADSDLARMAQGELQSLQGWEDTLDS